MLVIDIKVGVRVQNLMHSCIRKLYTGTITEITETHVEITYDEPSVHNKRIEVYPISYMRDFEITSD